MTLGLRTLQAN